MHPNQSDEIIIVCSLPAIFFGSEFYRGIQFIKLFAKSLHSQSDFSAYETLILLTKYTKRYAKLRQIRAHFSNKMRISHCINAYIQPFQVMLLLRTHKL